MDMNNSDILSSLPPKMLHQGRDFVERLGVEVEGECRNQVQLHLSDYPSGTKVFTVITALVSRFGTSDAKMVLAELLSARPLRSLAAVQNPEGCGIRFALFAFLACLGERAQNDWIREHASELVDRWQAEETFRYADFAEYIDSERDGFLTSFFQSFNSETQQPTN